jgi:trigger factor
VKDEITNVSDTQLNVVCMFDADEVAAERETVIGSLCREVTIPGFRRGKVPKNLVLSRFSDAVESRLHSVIVDKSLEFLNSKRNEVNIVAVTNVKRENVADGMVCTLEVDVIPEFELPDYWNIPIKPINVVVEEREIDDWIKNILRQHAKYTPVDREANSGDFVKLTYTAKFPGGRPVTDDVDIPDVYGMQTDTWEEAGGTNSHRIQAVSDGIVGVKAGDRKTIYQTFEKKFEIPGLAGQTISYDLEITEIRECIIPELTSDILQMIGAKSEGELRETVRSNIASQKTYQAKFDRRKDLVEKLSAMVHVNVPKSLVHEESASIINNFVNDQVARGVSYDDVETNSQEVFNSVRPFGTMRAKLSVALDKIAAKEKIEVLSYDIERMILQDAYEKRVNPDRYASEVVKDRSKLADVRRRALRGKVLDHLVAVLSKEKPENPVA